MCNLYSLARPQEELRRIFGVAPGRDRLGNQPPLPAIYPDQLAPVVVNGAEGREILAMRWGFPPPPKGGRPVTNIRNTSSSFWRAWMRPEYRCLVPATSFCEWTDSRPKVTHWFALDEARPIFAFAGLWRPWTGERRGEAGEHRLYSFLTTESNDVVRPVHAKAMPVILADPAAWETWLAAPVDEALRLQRPAPAELLRVVATGEKTDGLSVEG